MSKSSSGSNKSDATATAHRAWDKIWRTQEGRADYLVPEPEVIAVATNRHDKGCSEPMTALDLGCGVGRHALALAAMGYRTVAVDASPRALAELNQAAGQNDLSIDAIEAPMTELPVADASQDYVIAWNVIYHGDGDVVSRTVSEIYRVLRPGGTYQGTMLTKRNKHCGVGQEIATDTWINADGGDGVDKGHPHFYCDAAGLCRIFAGFEVISLTQNDQGRPGHWHWHVVLERR